MMCKIISCHTSCHATPNNFSMLFKLCHVGTFSVSRYKKVSNTCHTKSNTVTREKAKNRKSLCT